MKFEHQGRRRLTPKGSKALKQVEANVSDIEPGQGRILPSGEIVINHPEQGLLLLRTDNVHVYTPVVESANPLDSILGCKAEDDDDTPEVDDDKPLIDSTALSGNQSDKPIGAVTGNAGYANSYE